MPVAVARSYAMPAGLRKVKICAQDDDGVFEIVRVSGPVSDPAVSSSVKAATFTDPVSAPDAVVPLAQLVGRQRANWRALREVGDHANQRLCDAQAADARPAPDVATPTEVTRPSTTADGWTGRGAAQLGRVEISCAPSVSRAQDR